MKPLMQEPFFQLWAYWDVDYRFLSNTDGTFDLNAA